MPGSVNYQYFLVEIHKQEQLKKRNSIQLQDRPWLGLDGYFQDGCITVVGTTEGSPAQKAGFLSGDKIYQVDETPLKSFEHLVEYVWTKRPGDSIKLYYKGFLLATGPEEQAAMPAKLVTLDSKAPVLMRADNYVDMRYNLQWGTIRQIGKKAAQEFPVAEVGDILIFNHKVEYKERETGDGTYFDFHLTDVLENGNELRIVDYSYECYGVIKQGTAQIFPYKNVIFCHQNIRNAQMMVVDGFYLPDQWKKDIEELESDIEELDLQIQSITETTVLKANTDEENYEIKRQIFDHVRELQRRKAEIAKKMNEAELKELTVLYVNPKTCETLGHPIEAGDTLIANYQTLYPLDVGGVYYTLAHVHYSDILITHKNKEMKALYNKVVVRPDPPKTKTDGGLVIPDTAIKRSLTGTAVKCGPGSEEFPMLIQEGDRIRYGENAGLTFEHNGEKLLLISVHDVIIFGFTEKEEPVAEVA